MRQCTISYCDERATRVTRSHMSGATAEAGAAASAGPCVCLSDPHASNGQIGDIAVLRLLRPSSRPDDAHARVGAHLIRADPSLRCERARCQYTLVAVRLEGGRQRMGGGAAHGCRDQQRLRRCDGNATARKATGRQRSSAVVRMRMCETGHGSRIPFVCTFSLSSHTSSAPQHSRRSVSDRG